MTLVFESQMQGRQMLVHHQYCVIYVREDNDSNEYVMITRLVWITWTLMSTVPKRPLNLITHSLVHHQYQ